MSDAVMIVAGETSGELYGALLCRALKQKNPQLRIAGIGGERMQEAGVELVAGIASAFGIAEAVSSIKKIRATFKTAVAALENLRPRVLVLIDYPDFNLKLAEEARKRKIPVLYYVSPQVWAWRKKRVTKIAALVDRMAVILPFEEDIYHNAGLACEFVGHPIYDEIHNLQADKHILKKEMGFRENAPLLSLLPGSRPHEISRLLPVIAEVVSSFKKENPDFQFCVPFAPNTDIAAYDHIVSRLKQEGVVINKGESLRTLAASDYAVVASGTASLQAVLLNVPIVVVYKLFPVTYWIGKMIVKVSHISLVNLLARREVVRELLQSDATPQNIMNELKRLISDDTYRRLMQASYAEVLNMFAGKRASERVAEMVIEMSGSGP